MIQTKDKLFTVKDLEQFDAQGCRYELIEGELREMSPVGGTHGDVTLNLAFHVKAYVDERDLGVCMASEVGVLLGREPDTVFAPDFAFVSKGRLLGGIPDGYLTVIPDLVFETRSPGDTNREVEDKMRRWIEAGVRLAWDVDPKTQTVAVHQPGKRARIFGTEDSLAGEDVLPGFSLPVKMIFRAAR